MAEEGAIGVFAGNLRDLLLAAPAGSRATMGLDPGLRTGVKVAVVDATGKVVATDTVYPHEPRRAWDAALATLTKLAAAHDVELVAIGNGTASRETDKLARELAARNPGAQLTTVVVSEAGASVYSASAYASAELPGAGRLAARRGVHRPPPAGPARRAGEDRPQVDRRRPVPARPGRVGAVPLAGRRGRGLRERGRGGREHRVGAAAAPGLRDHRGAGRRRSWRTATRNGPFRTRTALADVPRLGPKAFEQCAGFLRIRGGDDPLDVSGVHPESYPVVHRILAAAGTDVAALIGNGAEAAVVAAEGLRGRHASGCPPSPTSSPSWRSPAGTRARRSARPPSPRACTALADLRPGMVLEGVVTNVAAFGAFVDVGVHQDGLVHVSAMSAGFVADPREVVKSGDVVRVKVLEVDEARKRISLTLRLDDEPGAGRRRGGEQQGGRPDDRGGDRRAGSGRRGRSARRRTAGHAGGGGGSQGGDAAVAPRARPAGPATARWPTPCAGPASPATAAAPSAGADRRRRRRRRGPVTHPGPSRRRSQGAQLVEVRPTVRSP